MFLISSRTKAQFYNNGQSTFLVQKDKVDFIFKVQRGVYLTASAYALNEDRLLLACAWGNFWNRIRTMRNRDTVMEKLRKACPLAANIFTNHESPHFVFLDKEQKEGAVVVEMKSLQPMQSFTDFINPKVVGKAMELIRYNLDL